MGVPETTTVELGVGVRFLGACEGTSSRYEYALDAVDWDTGLAAGLDVPPPSDVLSPPERRRHRRVELGVRIRNGLLGA